MANNCQKNQNGRVRSFAELLGAETAGKYQSISATDINENGVILANVLPASTNAENDEDATNAENAENAENADPTCKTKPALLIPFEIEEVISDQIPDNECNKLPTDYYKGEPNNPMLIATRSGNKAYLKVKIKVSDSIKDKTYVGLRKVGEKKILGYNKVEKVSPEKTPLEFDATLDPLKEEMYEVVAGYDKNDNKKLDDDEAQLVFEKTPRCDKDGKPSTAKYLDQIIVVPDSQFQSSIGKLRRNNVWGTDYAGDLVSAFARGNFDVPEATITHGIPIKSKEPGLSHPLGAKWSFSCESVTHRFTFENGSEASEQVDTSNALYDIIKETINDNLSSLKSSATDNIQTSHYFQFEEEVDFIETEASPRVPLVGIPLGINELGNAFGKVNVKGKIRVKYKKHGSKSVKITDIEAIGSFDDIYDFSYWGGDKARHGSFVQAGHASLSTPTKPSGKVFFTRVNFNTTDIGGWQSWNEIY